MESSRIFVKGLPPNLSPDDFRHQFSKQSEITDAKLIPHRRIGYVGYRTPEDAAKAIRYHNKSFIRMSKITVEPARSVEDQYALGLGIKYAYGSKRKHADVQEQGPIDTEENELPKRECEVPAESGEKYKLQEFLDVMRPPSMSKIWEYQDAHLPQVSACSSPSTEKAATQAAQSGDFDEHLTKKRKKEEQHGKKTPVRAEPPVSVDEPSLDASRVASDRDLSLNHTQESSSIDSTAVSDADWLRSRTSRLFGLIEDDDVQHTALPQDSTRGDAGLSESRDLFKEKEEGTVSDGALETHSKVEWPAFEKTNAWSGRLFVRNLAYTITELDLRKHFEDRGFGSIEEVSSELFHSSLFGSDSCDEHPDRDSLCYACDVIRENILVDIS